MKGNHTGKRNGLSAILLVLAVLLAGMGSFTMDVRAETETYEDEREADAGEALFDAPETKGTADGPDYEVTYDTVYFGEYPKSEILTQELVSKEVGTSSWYLYVPSDAEVDDALYGKLEATEYDGADETVLDDVRYRRIATAEDSSETEWRYFRYDPIRWRVLCVHSIEYSDRTTDCALLLSDQVLDILPFDEKGEGIWEESTLRKWLNEGFVHTAFTEDEYWNDIAIVEAEASDGSFEAYGEEGNTADDAFVLSGSELFGGEAEEYGFMPSRDNTWAGSVEDIARQARATRFALARGSGPAETDSALISWWTRSSVSDAEAGIVNHLGGGGSAGKDMTGIGIRPALWVDMENASEDYAYEGRLRITPDGYEIIRGRKKQKKKKKKKKQKEKKRRKKRKSSSRIKTERI